MVLGLARAWESRSPPIYMKRAVPRGGPFSLATAPATLRLDLPPCRPSRSSWWSWWECGSCCWWAACLPAGASRLRDHEAARNITDADRALEHARAQDRGWDRGPGGRRARAIAAGRPGWAYDELQLVLVDDRPGVEEDRAHFVASGGGESARVILARTDAGWSVEQID